MNSMYKIKTQILLLVLIACSLYAAAQKDSVLSQVPFDGQDQSWQNGNDRRDSSLLTSKYVTGIVFIDANATYSFWNPIDHTVVGSTALARDNEMEVSVACIGGEFNYEGARARILTQIGYRAEVVPRNDYSPYRGQYDLADAYRYLSEANAGYHFDCMHGINVDFGLFMSYIGLNSYYQVENWDYQASYTSDNTPWFFNGMRIQFYPTSTLKIEPWLINGWQSYGSFNDMPGFGGNITWCPTENYKLLTNNYYGSDVAGDLGRHRFHSDNSFLMRYYHNKSSKGISQAAFSFTFDIGDESGDGVNGFHNDSAKGPAQFFVSKMFYNRIWFFHNKFAWMIGGGVMNNPGRYLVLEPTGDASDLPNPYNPTANGGTVGTHVFTQNPGDQFSAWDWSTNIAWMPNQSIEFKLEFVRRGASVPYFNGPGGVTSPTGYTTTAFGPGTPYPLWAPDLRTTESRIIFAILFRI
jgi:hypothetical protein